MTNAGNPITPDNPIGREKSLRFPKPPPEVLKSLVEAECSRRNYQVCGAWLPRKNRVCPQRRAVGRTRCRFHGGKTPRGQSSPHFRHGRYSKDLPTSLTARHEALAAYDVTNLVDNIRLADARISELLAGLEIASAADRTSAWQEILRHTESKRKLVEAVRKAERDAQQMISVEQMLILVGQLGAMLRRFLDDRTLQKVSFEIEKILNGYSS